MRKPRNGASGARLPAVRPQSGGGVYRFGTTPVVVDQLYHVPARKPDRPGPWTREAEKIAWRDSATGLDCIIRRAHRGHLAGYVGVPLGHPLHGWSAKAIPQDLGIEVHGGLTYAAACDENGPPSLSICHVDHDTTRPTGGDVWWFGFECDKSYDLVPAELPKGQNGVGLVHGVLPEYRDEAYVYGQVVDLAGQLAAIGRGEPMPPRTSPPPPPLGLDPHSGSVRR
jgi:hypothetical protein